METFCYKEEREQNTMKKSKVLNIYHIFDMTKKEFIQNEDDISVTPKSAKAFRTSVMFYSVLGSIADRNN